MSFGSDKTTGRDTAIRNARLRLIELQVATHRIKAELARLEAGREDAAADKLVRGFSQVGPEGTTSALCNRVLPPEGPGRPATNADACERTRAEPRSRKNRTLRTDISESPRFRTTRRNGKPVMQSPLQASVAQRGEKSRVRQCSVARKSSPALLLSLVVHVVLIFLLGMATFATWQSNSLPLLASSFDPVETVAEMIEIEVAPLPMADSDLENAVSDLTESQMTDVPFGDFSELAVAVSSDLGREFGFTDSLPGDIGTLMAGAGRSAPAEGGRRTSFFGTAAEGKRFVFVVDNSGSMQDGRMETTFNELIKSVRAMQPDQRFYVVFYSDQVYPLFFPASVHTLVPPTKENISKLQDWLTSVELCTGGRLRDAMELVAELEPQVVYLLSDGEIGSEGTMTYMTESASWPFVVHTLGMTVRGPAAANKLTGIADAHGGTFRLVRPDPAAIQLANRRPIKYNRTKGVIWGSKVRAR